MTAAEAWVGGPNADVLFVGHLYGAPRPEPPLPQEETWMLTFTLAGQRRYDGDHWSFLAVPGTLALFGSKQGMPEVQELHDPWECLYVRFKAQPGWSPSPSFERLAEDAYRAHVTLAAVRQRINDAFVLLAADAHSRLTTHAITPLDGDAASRAPAGDARRQLLLLNLTEIMMLVEADKQDASRLDARVRQALEIMAASLAEPHSVGSLARIFDLSPSHFAHLFRKELGISPVHVLRRMRLQQVALRLQHGMDTIETIAEQTGFSSNSHLSREFRRAFGVSPRDYRARWGG